MPAWRDVKVLYRREVLSALRERTIVVNSILVPIFLYPFMLWAMFTGLMFVRGQTEGQPSRVAVASWPPGHADLAGRFDDRDRFRLLDPAPDEAEADALIRRGALDAYVEFRPPAAGALAGNFRVRLTYDESSDRSGVARDRVTEAIDRYREAWLRREATALSIDQASWEGFAIETRNVASGRDMGRFILGLLLPLFFVVMVAVGCFYPAVDTTAGERERGTWETLMSVAASRTSIVTAKYLYVATFGCVAGTLNLAAVTLTMRPVLAPLLARTGEHVEFSMPLAALPILALGALLLAGFVAAGMMLFASFARTFREGQSMITPFYLLILLPVMFLQVPGIRFSLALAAVPVVNVTMMVREAVAGVFHWPQLGVTVAVSLAAVAACIYAATFILRFEDVVLGSYSGGLAGFVRERVLSRRRRPAAGSHA
jgi:sodium transport system permease protein